MDTAVEVTYHDDGTLASIAASATCEDSDATVSQRIEATVAASRSLLLHAHNDLDLLAEKAPDDASTIADHEQH